MIKFVKRVFKTGTATEKDQFPDLDSSNRGLPSIVIRKNFSIDDISPSLELCPTQAIKIEDSHVYLDLGCCISCGICTRENPAVFTTNSSTRTAREDRSKLIISSDDSIDNSDEGEDSSNSSIFAKAISVRVVSTGCTSCDLEVGAAFNSVFDAERFGVKVVASPRMADALVVTGPVGAGMKDALIRTYEAMPEPKLVVALGTCSISGGIHKGGYAQANGLEGILPIDVYIPGCPPHPWSIIHGIKMAMNKKV